MKIGINLRYSAAPAGDFPSHIFADRIFEVPLLDEYGKLAFNLSQLVSQVTDEGLIPTDAGLDLLCLAAAVFGADTKISREATSQNDWTREITLSIPVANVVAWEEATPLLEKALKFLSGDIWTLHFKHRPANLHALMDGPQQMTLVTPSCVSLFSGGLDSFIGAIDLLERRERPMFISHSWVSIASHHQTECLRALENTYGVDSFTHIPGRIGFGKATLDENMNEDTERSRSFLFLAMAAFAASSLPTHTTIFVPENGLISLNVALDPLRLGSLSTRTTHPYFMARINELLV